MHCPSLRAAILGQAYAQVRVGFHSELPQGSALTVPHAASRSRHYLIPVQATHHSPIGDLVDPLVTGRRKPTCHVTLSPIHARLRSLSGCLT